MTDLTLKSVVEKPVYELFNNLFDLSRHVESRIASTYPIGERTNLQRCIVELGPNCFSIIYSFRHLIVSGYVFGAELLLRPLLDRVATIAYLSKAGNEALEIWLRGWKFKERPSIKEMVLYISEPKIDLERLGLSQHNYLAEFIRETVDDLNQIIHPDPIGNFRNIVEETDSGSVGLFSGPNFANPDYTNRVLLTAIGLVSSLLNELSLVFPKARDAK